VRDRTSVTLSLPLNTRAGPDNPDPAVHFMTSGGDRRHRKRGLRFAMDFVGADYHHDGHTHIDALCHVAYERVPLRITGGTGSPLNPLAIL
jgi:hypothetical protein